MDDLERQRRRMAERETARRRLRQPNPRCLCGVDDPICLELHHIGRRKLSNDLVAICKNCHAKATSRQVSEHPPLPKGDPTPADRMRHTLEGLALLLELEAEQLRRLADQVAAAISDRSDEP